MREEFSLGPPPEDHDSYEVTAEWDGDQHLVFLKDWDPFEGRFLNYQPLTPEQMDRLVAWWQHQRLEER